MSIKTIKEGKEYLKDNFKKGVTCPCCNQFVKLYKRKLNQSMAFGLTIMYKLHTQKGFDNYLKMNLEIAKLKIPSSNIEYPKLAYFKLIEEVPKPMTKDDKKNTGLWRLTKKGVAFVEKSIEVPAYALIYNGKCWGYSDEKTNIITALGTKFNYNELMND